MRPDELIEIWDELPAAASGGFQGQELGDETGLWAAVDPVGQPHLLIEVPEDTVLDAETHGLQVTIGEHEVAGTHRGTFIDLVCVDDQVMSTFAAVAAEVGTAGQGVSIDSRPDVVADALARWQWFWGVDPSRLTDEDAVGLFGELWFLLRWCGSTPASVRAWTASRGSRQDFQWTDVSVEVKASASVGEGGVVHQIGSLDQLADPETGVLQLFSLELRRDELANNSLANLVDAVIEALGDDSDAVLDFRQKLGRRGYNPAARERYEVGYRILRESLYRIDSEFPRLTTASFTEGVPAQVTNVAYWLAMAGCESWLITRRPSDWLPPAL